MQIVAIDLLQIDLLSSSIFAILLSSSDDIMSSISLNGWDILRLK